MTSRNDIMAQLTNQKPGKTSLPCHPGLFHNQLFLGKLALHGEEVARSTSFGVRYLQKLGVFGHLSGRISGKQRTRKQLVSVRFRNFARSLLSRINVSLTAF
jgi:hypothetical protein